MAVYATNRPELARAFLLGSPACFAISLAPFQSGVGIARTLVVAATALRAIQSTARACAREAGRVSTALKVHRRNSLYS